MVSSSSMIDYYFDFFVTQYNFPANMYRNSGSFGLFFGISTLRPLFSRYCVYVY